MSNRTYLHLSVSVIAFGLMIALPIRGQEQQPQEIDCPMKMDKMNERGDKAMGFDHMKTTHHFLLASDGGAIQVEASNATDKQSRDQIRQHLRHIAVMFSEGNFDTPMLVHAQKPPGTAVMQRFKTEITYKYEETERGALIRISTSNPDGLQAIYEFLRFQIKEHMTGDPLEASAQP